MSIQIYEDGKLLDIDPIAILAILKPEQLEHGTAFGIYCLESPNVFTEKFWLDLPYNLNVAMPHVIEMRRLAKIETERNLNREN